jgi:helix-turn-helix, Psq domain
MTTSQASRIFGIPYNSLLMYVRGKYGKSLKLEQLRKDCISGPPIELLQMGSGHHKEPGSGRREKEMKEGAGGAGDGHHHRSASSEPDLMSSPNPLFNPFPPGFYPDFSGGFPGFQHMLNLLPPDRHPSQMAMNMIDEDCKSDRSKQSLEDDMIQNLSREDSRREIFQLNGHVDK